MNNNNNLSLSKHNPTLLPAKFAQSVTAIALSTKFSLRTAAFLIELFLDSLRNTTTSSIDIARKLVITALNSSLKKCDPNNSFEDLESLSLSSGLSALGINCNSNLNDVHLRLLEGYTGLGELLLIYDSLLRI